ncbi:methyltransferase domain-containing protein [Candidatus Poribacteria bacterium]|nr:methyltransferase domain-containing protein [Candidatus Poribacteria bacterium]
MDQIHDAVRQQFSQHAKYYAQSKVHSEGETLGVLVDFAEPNGAEKALDIATGTGFTAFAFAPKVAHVIATDLTPAMLDQAKTLADERGLKNIDFQVASAEALPFEAAHHFQDVPQFLLETYRVLCPGGLFCMVDSVCPESERLIEWQNRVEKLRDHSHVWGYPPSQWQNMIEETGFTIEKEVHTHNALQPFSWWADRPGNSPELVRQLRAAFDELTPEEEPIFAIQREPEEFYFAWPMYCVKARKLDAP